MSKIINIIGRQILDSRGMPTVEADVILESGAFGRSSVPSGLSIGKKEAVELRDNNKSLYLGKSVFKATSNININIRDALIGIDACDQRLVDQILIKLDGTKNKSVLGANAILAVSLASAKASASNMNQSLYRYLINSKQYIMPVPMINVINGGKHASNNIDIQEFMIIPAGFSCFKDALRCGVEIFHVLKKIILDSNYLIYGVGDEGGYIPNFSSNELAIQMIVKAIEKAGYLPGHEVYIGLDIASNELYHNKKYVFKLENKSFTSNEFIDYFYNLVNKYPIISIEDAMAEDDLQGWKSLTDKLGDKIQLVGDDLFVTNSNILYKKGIKQGIANAILIKLNQIGTLTECLETMAMASKFNYTSIISHRSGETSDTIIADFAVATSSGQIKTGSLCRSERISKYNQLLRIEEELDQNCLYYGIKSFMLDKNHNLKKSVTLNKVNNSKILNIPILNKNKIDDAQ